MSINHKLQNTLNGIALVAFLAVAPMASAQVADLKINDCGTIEQIIAGLEPNQQRIAVANMGVDDNKATASAAIYSNNEGSKGYLLYANAPRGQQPTKVCVKNILSNVTVNDTNLPGVPEWAKIGGDKAAAEKTCKSAPRQYNVCVPHDWALEKSDTKSNERVMIQATGQNTAGGQEPALITITYNPDAKDGFLFESYKKSGIAYMSGSFEDIQYTDVGFAMATRKHNNSGNGD